MYRWIGGVAAGLVVLAFLASGCGGDSEASSLTKAEYVTQANEICAKRKNAWDTALTSYRKKAEKENAIGNVKAERELAEEVMQDTMLPALDQQVESLEDLGLPEGKEEQAEKMVKNLAKKADAIKSPSDVAASGFGDFEEEAKDLGVNCPL